MVTSQSSPFGSATRTQVLKALRLVSESYPRELSRLIGIRLAAVQGALRSLERDGLVAGRLTGSLRLYQLEPRYFARRELGALLDRLVDADPALRREITALRRRPRRSGKPLR